MKKQFLFSLFAMFIAAISFVSCSNDDDVTAEPTNEEEEITSVVLSINGQNFTFDVENNTKETIVLDANKTYAATIGFFNGDEVVTTEIEEENAEHLICYTPANANVTVTRTDKDENDKEIGLTTSWVTGAASTGTVSVKLKHQPDIKASGDEDCNAGGTDVDITFDIKVQ